MRDKTELVYPVTENFAFFPKVSCVPRSKTRCAKGEEESEL